MAFFLFVLAGLFVLTVISGIYVFIVACVRKKELSWLIEDEIKNTPYGKFYSYIVASNQWLLDHQAQDVYITSDDGLRLHGLWVPVQNARGTVLFAHGYRSTMLVDFGMAFELYHKIGMNLLIPEQRSHGKSQGRYITFGVKESNDMMRWIQYHNDELSRKPILLSGISMGASTMIYLADKDLPSNVKGIVADCGFTSPREIIKSVFKSVIHLPAAPTLLFTDIMTRLFAGFSLSEKDSRKILKNSKLPIIMIHGMDDDFVPCRMTQEGFSACTGPKQLLLVDGAEHGVSFLVDPERYTAIINEFLDKYMKEE